MNKKNIKRGTHYDPETKTLFGAKLKPLYDKDCSFGRIVFEQLRRRPNKICQISDSENTRLTNEEVLLQAIRIARHFQSMGIKQSDIIGISARNTTYVLGVVVACFFSGSAYHALNPNFDKATAKHLFEITKPKVIFCDGQDVEKTKLASIGFETKIFTVKNHIEGVPSVLDLISPTGDEHEFEPVDLEKGTKQSMAILCSSGSTGLPKAVTISNRNLCSGIMDFLTNDDVAYFTSTLDWFSGLLALVACLRFGALRIVSDKPYTPEYYLEVIEKYKITFTLLSPPAMASLVKSKMATPEKLDSMRYLFYGGSACTAAIQEKMRSLIRNGNIYCVYGFTELNSGLTRNDYFDLKPQSVGTISPGFKVRIIDGEDKILGPNETGEILVSHDLPWEGYYNNPEATRTMHDDRGWFHTGDLGYFDEDNYLYIVERIKELLKYKGYHFYPSEIEGVIARMPQVKNVCVFGIQSDEEGDIAAAVVVKVEGSSLTEKDVVEFVHQNDESIIKQLHAGCIFLNEIPKTANGKTDRKGAKNIFLKMKFNGV